MERCGDAGKDGGKESEGCCFSLKLQWRTWHKQAQQATADATTAADASAAAAAGVDIAVTVKQLSSESDDDNNQASRI